MLQILELTKNNLIATKATGNLTETDIEKIHPLVHAILDRGMKVRWYLEMDHFDGWDIQAFWEDLNMGTVHANDFERIAMVGEKKWQDWISLLMVPFTSAEIRYFDLADKEKAKGWIEE